MKEFRKGQVVPEFLRDGGYRHVPGVLDEEPRWLLRQTIRLLSANVLMDPSVVDQIRSLSGTCAIVYALKFRSLYDLHFLRIRLTQSGLPVPSFVFGMSASSAGSPGKLYDVLRARLAGLIHSRSRSDVSDRVVVQEILEKGGAGLMFLVDEKSFRPRYVHPDRDPLSILLDIQGHFAGSIALVPLTILYDRTPRRIIRPFWESLLGDPDRPGPLKRILLATRRYTVPELLVGEPVHLVAQFEEFGSGKSWEELPFDLRRQLTANINARIRVARGPEKLSRTEIKEQVLREPRVQKAVAEIAAREKTPPEKVRKKAESYVEEIAADQHLQVHHFLYYLLKSMFSHAFDGVDLKLSQFTALKAINQKGSLVFVSCHKSHFDYLLVGFLTFVNQMAIPYFAAGKNLSFWPLGPILRNAGAFFLRRSFKGMDLYTQVFAAYVKVLIREKFNIKFYIEGGRSRTGKLMPPRLGMLSFLVKAVTEGAADDLSFVPTFLGYDRIPEEKSYLAELSGFDKNKESLLNMIRARKMLKTRYGKVYVRFDEPISFRAFCKQWRGGIDPVGISVGERQDLLNDLAYHVMAGIVRAEVITPTELTAAALICASDPRVGHGNLVRVAHCLSEVLENDAVEQAERAEDVETAMLAPLKGFSQQGLIEIAPQEVPGAETVYLINEQKRAYLEFYRNALVNHLWPASLLSFILRQGGLFSKEATPAIREWFKSLREILSRELIVDPLVGDDAILEKTFSLFRRKGWLEAPTQPNSTDLDPLRCLKGILADLLEVYYLVLAVSDDVEPGTHQKEYQKKMVKKAQDLRGIPEGQWVVSIASVTLTNALTRFQEMGIIDYAPAKKTVRSVRNPFERDRLKELLSQVLGI